MTRKVNMTTRKAKMREERYTSMEDVLRAGKYKGRTIKEMLLTSNYIADCYHRGSIVMTRALWLQCLDMKEKYKMAEMESRPNVTSTRLNSYKNAMGRASRTARTASLETREPCIHESCWCAHHGCNHRSRNTCDQDILHRDGVASCTYSKCEDVFFNRFK